MTKFKTIALGISAAALAIGGVAVAETSARAPGMRGFDANGDGVITKAEAQTAAAALFAKLDANKDGKLDKADREQARAQMREQLFTKLDTNSDGAISRAEFMADHGPGHGPDGGPDGGPGMMPPPPGGPMDDGHRGHGRGPGVHHGMGGMAGMGGPGAMMMMAKMADTNNDGAISQVEFMAAADARFDKMDTNHDGRITKEERQAAHEAMRAKWKDGRKAATDKPAAN